MNFELKKISQEGIPTALQKAERYRLLNEPWQAESICRDILAAEPGHQQALITLVLAITDQFRSEGGKRLEEAQQLLERMDDPYRRTYYAGMVWERRAMAQLTGGAWGAGNIAYEGLRRAMELYEQAERMRPAGNDETLLRWNTCARVIMNNEQVRPPAKEEGALPLE